MIFDGSLALWTCSYRGRVQEGVDPSEVFSYLRTVLKNEVMHVRLATNYEHRAGDWEYICHGEGCLTEFSGKEEIRYQDRSVYRLDYFGGNLI